MFERFRCYRSLFKMEKCMKGCIRSGLILNNEDLIRMSEIALRKVNYIKKRAWYDRKLAIRYNQGMIKFK